MSNRAIGPGGDIFGLSQSLWGNVPLDLLATRDRNIGWMAGDDFTNFGVGGTILTSNLGWYNSEGNSYRTFEALGGSTTSARSIIANTAGTYTVPTGFPIMSQNLQATLFPVGSIIPTPGQITLTATGATDQAQMQLGPSTAALNSLPFTPYPLANMVPMSVYFETRLKFSALATGFTTFFIGLAGVGAGVTSVPAATATYTGSASAAATSLLGFGCLSGDDTETLGLVYAKSGQAPCHQKVANMAGLNLLTLLGTSGDYTKGYKNIGDNVYFKLGFEYDGLAKTLTPYINGVALDGNTGPNKVVGSGTLSTNLGTAAGGTGSSTLWPAAPMTFTAGLFQTNTTYQTVTLDWWRCAQVY